MIKVITAALITCLFCTNTWAAANPSGSRFDSRMQQVAYNPLNSTVVNTMAGYLTTLVFADDENVISARAGFPKGWTVDKEANRVYVQPEPVTQPVTKEDGTTANQAFLPESKNWKTNLFVTTTKHFYSLELNVLDDGSPTKNLSFVIAFTYPDDVRKSSEQAMAARQKEWTEALEKQNIQKAFNAAKSPRNWDYTKRVAEGSENIAPDFVYDDGRFMYLGFSPLKKIPAPFYFTNGQEQSTAPAFTSQGNYRVMVLNNAEKVILRLDNTAVVGIDNQGFGKVRVANTDTVSPAVKLEDKP
ncbi:TrbG/VirB9 family P-type conjugative transfer protein [Lelliottia sp. V89_10]|uniref:TrbG/VirB9 family P-type conjugative transfer protein n=1 Tax=Lelliottia wanjuensis TaxID=3050585 RepID=UPI00249E69F5|nr:MULTISPECIES: TrbG/VirB9 family P-type conjugative transfer protein [unclassified Lelliottia]MDI3360322.1 TrbG/VirB9 family P-type conjugative transfer protein [Lelliottia sp. V89_13]MDK9549452.1 TrbG/VirB9 family P-type conjugative transfer protein [Lelliottia sp. V89_5]MDK9596133.1 TrbG/VirB9 family P-type conjugative transfer protein [Lelliottia sp. V89_10]